ncbi:MAG: TetR/AcrR family transcriptional regulator [Nocardioides sp.]|uniref:TetR/AcrR family transcriptional regulator n=1 Tax=Nocardioides sp. TaxID=35761 RepID=UPI003F0CA963
MSTDTVPSESTDGRRSAAAVRRRQREREILDATRNLFDERGVSEAQIEDIAKAVGINRAIVYRHFIGKEELFALTLVGYLEELRAILHPLATDGGSPEERLTAIVSAFVDYGIEYPAFVDCALTLMRRRGAELFDELSESALFRLGKAMTGCLTILSDVVEEGTAQGEFGKQDPNLLANMMYATGLGALQIARVGILVKESAPGVPVIGSVSADQVREYLVTSVLAQAIGRPRP